MFIIKKDTWGDTFQYYFVFTTKEKAVNFARELVEEQNSTYFDGCNTLKEIEKGVNQYGYYIREVEVI